MKAIEQSESQKFKNTTEIPHFRHFKDKDNFKLLCIDGDTMTKDEKAQYKTLVQLIRKDINDQCIMLNRLIGAIDRAYQRWAWSQQQERAETPAKSQLTEA